MNQIQYVSLALLSGVAAAATNEGLEHIKAEFFQDQERYSPGMRVAAGVVAGALVLSACAAPQTPPKEVVEIHHYHQSTIQLSPTDAPSQAFFSGRDGTTFIYEVPLSHAYRVQGEEAQQLVHGLTALAAGYTLSKQELSSSIGDLEVEYISITTPRHFASDSLLLQVLQEADQDGNHVITLDDIKKLVKGKRNLYGNSVDILLESTSCDARKSAALEECVSSFNWENTTCKRTDKDKQGEIKWNSSDGKRVCDDQQSSALWYARGKDQECTDQKSTDVYYCKKDSEARVAQCGTDKYYAKQKLDSWKSSADWACKDDPAVAVNICKDQNQKKYDQGVRDMNRTLADCEGSSKEKLEQCTGQADQKYTSCHEQAETQKGQANSTHKSCVSGVEEKTRSAEEEAEKTLEQCLSTSIKTGQGCVSQIEKKFAGCGENSK
ncbi:hypothetical protein HYX12_04390 [Candidatus Woesearchaeota archaeon]|nr:hypothetical protein [Candidatus Woesearchaeota archaeon]